MKLVDSGTSFERFKVTSVICSVRNETFYTFPAGLLLFHQNGYRYLVGDSSYSNVEGGEYVSYDQNDITQFLRWELYEY